MNAYRTSSAKLALTAAIVAASAGSALAQVTHDRTVGPADISITPVAGEPGQIGHHYSIGVRTYTLNRTGTDVNLSDHVIVTVNDEPITALYRIIWVGPGQGVCNGNSSSCSGDACWAASSCKRASDGGCACFDYYDFVLPGPFPLTGGDRVGVQLIAASDAAPEQYTENDAASVVFTPCPADFNGSGSTSVQDIFDFLAAYFAGSPAADFNTSGNISVQDIFDFLAAYFAGCP